MTRGVTFPKQPIFSELMSKLGEITTNDEKPTRHLRLVNGSRLYTHDPNKWHGLKFWARWEKHENAYAFVKQALEAEVGEEKAQLILAAAEFGGKKSSITIADMHKLNEARGRTLKLESDRDRLSTIPKRIELTAEQNREIADALSAMLTRADGRLSPHFVSDAPRSSRVFTSGNARFDLQEKVAGLSKDEVEAEAFDVIRGCVEVEGDTPEVSKRKTLNFSTILDQEGQFATYNFIVERILDGDFGGKLVTRRDIEKKQKEEDGEWFCEVRVHYEKEVNEGEPFSLIIDLYKPLL
jgi:hypothetical protein